MSMTACSLLQISCASLSAELSDRVRFPYYFQLVPSEVNLARVFYSIIKEYGWRRVALIVQNQSRFKTVCMLFFIKSIMVNINTDGSNFEGNALGFKRT